MLAHADSRAYRPTEGVYSDPDSGDIYHPWSRGCILRARWLTLHVLGRGAWEQDRGISGAAAADAAGLQGGCRAAAGRPAAAHAPGIARPFPGHCLCGAAGMPEPWSMLSQYGSAWIIEAQHC